MQAPVSYKLLDQQLWLSAHRSVFWEEEKALIVSDLHFGKTGHFRKSGIAVPQAVYKEDLQRLVHLIQYFQPRQIIAVGDLFHSHQNKELELFQRWRHDFPDLPVHLVKGNHDILHESWYKQCNIHVIDEELQLGAFRFRHDLDTVTPNDTDYFFSGHIHPGIRLRGAAKQSLSFPCFYFAKAFCVLPAFSRFTGIAIVRPEDEENVFAIVNDNIVQLQ
ncbi:metallophosphoesterase [Niastella koreensis]|uniref:Metallophosphoesterase n=2 Tax=Niastella koreensis TaxID=354356 RepID=G8T9Z3_NIAKG|nr:ligase-associated DNA damage response endonuclease PdeM [Niastella koreensis]AEW01337.1 metallophosphoesterase [Niastella koreensis GR20-10]OQP46332.1 metallophosphoesterase [Niastella koreensis]